MSTDLLTVEGVRVHFPVSGGPLSWSRRYLRAVDGVSFRLRRGQTLGLVGESGCGKSTLGRSVIRLYQPTAGKIVFDGTDITHMQGEALRRMRRRMQIVFQDPVSSLNPRMTVNDTLAEPLYVHSVGSRTDRRRRVAELLEMVGLGSEAGMKYPHEFSGGQRQRIGIARALALEPSLIIADEPVSALDVSIQSQILNLMVDLRSRLHLSYLFISHDLAVVEHISDIVAVMYLGRIVEQASSEQIYARPSHPYTKLLISSIPGRTLPALAVGKTPDRTNVAGSGDIPNPISPPSGCAFHPRCPAATEICRRESPTMRELRSGQSAACHHAD